MQLDYFLYMSEAEGWTSAVTTRSAKINAIINDFTIAAKNGHNINNIDFQKFIFNKYHFEDLASEESRYIAQRVQEKI